MPGMFTLMWPHLLKSLSLSWSLYSTSGPCLGPWEWRPCPSLWHQRPGPGPWWKVYDNINGTNFRSTSLMHHPFIRLRTGSIITGMIWTFILKAAHHFITTVIIIINDSIYPAVSKVSRRGYKVSCQPSDCPNRWVFKRRLKMASDGA